MKPTTLILAVTILFLPSCTKDKIYEAGNGNADQYTSLQDFYDQNEVRSQFYSINAATGGSFSTSQGTLVTIPPYAFINMMGDTVTGIITIEFKDLYKKSDMLLSDKHTVENFYGSPIKSGGEFYIRASVNNQSVLINLPANNTSIDEQNLSDEIKIFPNPVKDELFVSGYSLTGKEKAEIIITDVLGKEIYRDQFLGSNFKFPVSNFKSGIYFLEINDGKNSFRKKFLKE